MVPETGIEPVRELNVPRDFKSLASACSATPANNEMEATPGFEPGMEDLQSSALPLGYVASKLNGAEDGI